MKINRFSDQKQDPSLIRKLWSKCKMAFWVRRVVAFSISPGFTQNANVAPYRVGGEGAGPFV